MNGVPPGRGLKIHVLSYLQCCYSYQTLKNNQFDIFRSAQTLGSFLLHRAALEKKTVWGHTIQNIVQSQLPRGFPALPKVSAQTPHSSSSKLTFLPS